MTLAFPDVSCTLIDHLASDDRVVQAMLVSTQGSDSLDASASAGRINFLMRGRHGSPFEHNSFTFYVKAPIFVFREYMRHRIGFSYNEVSGRYVELAPNFYLPPEERPLKQVGKPGSYKLVPAPAMHQYVLDETTAAYEESWHRYQNMLDAGVAKEVARNVLPVGIFSEMYVTCNARSMMSFLSLRTDEPESTFPSKPLWEIDELVARRMEAEFERIMPLTYESWNENGRVSP